MADKESVVERTSFETMVANRFGVLPNFFRSGVAAPGLIEQLWNFALASYLDNPLPSLFKERMFVFLSQFCPVRYCIVRHVGFLLGYGRPSGDAAAPPHTIDQVISLLKRPRTDLTSFDKAIARLSDRAASPGVPEPDTQFEKDLFDALTLLFLSPLAARGGREAVRGAVGDQNFEYLVAFLAFVRTAHYWTETHPEIDIEVDMQVLMAANEQLRRLLLNPDHQG